MFNIGFSELLVVGVIALIFIGPQQLPEVARTIGRMLNELRRATDDLKGGFTSDVQNTIAKARAPIAREAAPEPAPTPPVTEAATEAAVDPAPSSTTDPRT